MKDGRDGAFPYLRERSVIAWYVGVGPLFLNHKQVESKEGEKQRLVETLGRAAPVSSFHLSRVCVYVP